MAEFTAKGANILVVDDDDDIREIVHILLAREGFTVREAANAEQALPRDTHQGHDADFVLVRQDPRCG